MCPQSRRAVLAVSLIRAALTQARPGASPEVLRPLQRSLAAPRCPELPASGRSRCGVWARPAMGPHGSACRRTGEWSRWGPVATRAVALAVLRLRPPRRPWLPCRRGSGAGSTGSCTAAPSRPVFRYPNEPSRDLAGANPSSGHRWRSWGCEPFAALLPPAGFAAFPPPGPTCRFAGSPPDAHGSCVVGPSGRLSPTGGFEGVPSAGCRPRLLGFVPACDPCRAVGAPPRPMPPWAFPLSGVRSSTPARRLFDSVAGVPLVGFAGVRSDLICDAGGCAFGRRSFVPDTPGPTATPRTRRLARAAFAAARDSLYEFSHRLVCLRRLRRTVLMCYTPDAKAASVQPARCSADLNLYALQRSKSAPRCQWKIRRPV